MNSRKILDHTRVMIYRIEEYMEKKLNNAGACYYAVRFDSTALEFEIDKSLFKYNTLDDIKRYISIFSNDVHNLDVSFTGNDADAFINILYDQIRHDIFEMDNEDYDLWIKLQ